MLKIRKNYIPMDILKHHALRGEAELAMGFVEKGTYPPFTDQLLTVYTSIKNKLPHLIVEPYSTTFKGGTQYVDAIGVRDVGSKCYTAIIFHAGGKEQRDSRGSAYTTPHCFIVASSRYDAGRAVLEARHGYVYSSRRLTSCETVVKEVARLRPISTVEILASAYDSVMNEVRDFMRREDITRDELRRKFLKDNAFDKTEAQSFLFTALKTMMEGQVLCLSDVPKALMQAYVKYTTDVTDATGVINKDTNQYHVMVAAFKDGDIVCAYYPNKDYRLQGWKCPEIVTYKRVDDMPYAIQLKLNTLEVSIPIHPDLDSYAAQEPQELAGVGVKINKFKVISECYLVGVANETINELSQNVKV
jgi:hypothetical protein